MVRPTQSEMETDSMTGKSQLGVQRVPAQPIPKMSKVTTRVGDGNSNDKTGMSKDMTKKLKKVMQAKGMIDKC